MPATVHELNALTDVDARLAVELALRLRTPQELLATYNLSAAALAKKIKDPMFADMVKQARQLWRSDLSVKERIRLKSQLLVEDSLLEIFRVVHDSDLTLQGRLDAFKQLTKVADVEQSDSKNKQDLGTRFTVHINLGDDNRSVTIDGGAAQLEESHDG